MHASGTQYAIPRGWSGYSFSDKRVCPFGTFHSINHYSRVYSQLHWQNVRAVIVRIGPPFVPVSPSVLLIYSGSVNGVFLPPGRVSCRWPNCDISMCTATEISPCWVQIVSAHPDSHPAIGCMDSMVHSLLKFILFIIRSHWFAHKILVRSRTDYFVRIPPSTMVVVWLPTFRICVTARSVTVGPLSLSENLKVFKNAWFAHTSLFL